RKPLPKKNDDRRYEPGRPGGGVPENRLGRARPGLRFIRNGPPGRLRGVLPPVLEADLPLRTGGLGEVQRRRQGPHAGFFPVAPGVGRLGPLRAGARELPTLPEIAAETLPAE